MRKLITMMLWILPLSVLAQEAADDSLLRRPMAAQEPLPLDPIGAKTREWTDLQVSNSAASTTPRPLTGEVAGKVYERYLKSYDQPIPKTFQRDSFTTDSGGGGGK